jgi:hypothetical protein
MKLNDVFGKKLTNAYIKTKLSVNGLDHSEVCLEIEGKTTIKFPWGFKNVNLKKQKSWRSKSIKRTQYFKPIRNTVIVDFLILDNDEPMNAGFFELDNGKIIYEETTFPTGAMATGLNILPSVNSIKEVFDMEFVRYSDHYSFKTE